MDQLAQLSRNENYRNPLSVLINVVETEMPKFKLAMLISDQLPPAHFQVTGFCDTNHCPIYSAEAMLTYSAEFKVLEGEFVESWKTLYSPQIISCEQCPELFQNELRYFGEAIIVPIWIEGSVERWIVLVDYQSNSNHSDTNLPDLTRLSLLLNYALTNILRAEQKRQLDKARKWIDEEISEISRLQKLLLPPNDIELPGAKIAFKYKTYKQAGGDYLDLSVLPSLGTDIQHWGGVIADVTGHGPSAAVEAAMLDAMFRTFRGDETTTPADVANYINENFFSRRDRGKFVTAKLFTYNSGNGILRYVSAGHPSAYVKRGEQVFKLDQSKDIPIGVLQDYQWSCYEFTMRPGDILFVYTDVVLETRSPNEQEFGFERLQQSLIEASNDPKELIDFVEQALIDFSGNEHFQDDLTLCAIRIEE